MKKNFKRTISIRLAVFLVASASLYADSLTWGGTHTGVWSNFGTSPYTAFDQDLNKTIMIFCLDFNDEIAPPFDWQASIYKLTPANVDAKAQFGGNYGNGVPGFNLTLTGSPFAFQSDTAPNPAHSVDLALSPTAYIRYLEAAWLFSNILKARDAGDLNTEIISQVAAWDLFVEAGQNFNALHADIAASNNAANLTFNNYLFSNSGYASAPATVSATNLYFQDAVDEALKAAQEAVVNQNWAGSAYMENWELVTADPAWAQDVNHKAAQEFLTPSIPHMPEPGAIILLGTVMAGIGFSRYRRHKRS